MLALSLAACTDSTESSSQSSSGSSSVAEQSSEPDTSDLTVKEEEDVSKLDTKPETKLENGSQAASQPPVEQKPTETSKPEKKEDVSKLDTKPEANPVNGSQAASQPPVEQKPAETSKPEKEEDVSNLDTKVDSKPVKPVEQPIQPSTPAAPETDDTGWTQAKVDAVVEAYRSAALERGWTEDTSLNIELTTGGAWGTPIDTSWANYKNEVDKTNIEEYLYLLEYSRNEKPEDMYFNNIVVDHGNGRWEIYFIFA